MEVQQQLETHRRALTGHCYRMLGSAADADDAVQETMIRALRGRFDGRSALSTWLYRIATNVCLDALSHRSRRERPVELGPPGGVGDELVARERTHWLEPVPEASVLPRDAAPAERAMLRQSIRLAYVAALQHLPPRQRAVLLLREVVGLSAQETAETLEASVASVNSALQRARATLAAARPTPAPAQLTAGQRDAVEAFAERFEAYDTDGLIQLLCEDAALSMPPFTLWLQGPDAIRAWWLGPGAECQGSRLVRVDASGAPAFAQYRRQRDAYFAWSLLVLDLRGERIAAMTHFLDAEELFPRFGLSLKMPMISALD